MPRLVKNGMKSRPWQAKAVRERLCWHLGYFATKEEAFEAEQRFNAQWPKKPNRIGSNQKECLNAR